MTEELKIIISAQTEKLKAGCKDAATAIKGVDNEGKKAGNNSEKHFEKMGKAAKKAGAVMAKGLAVGLAAAATGVVALTKAATEGYAEYEQLIGGVETLFKDSAGIVEGYANNAYKSAGMSANAYMETITGFSASLLQSLGGDTAKAAEYGNQAVINMSDNANKMGTSMESIQNAYQGFAKQNYTMLDNLKLGYGGTKKEMQRLLDDAEKISGIKYDISNFGDITQAIHTIQTELGITGTTAKEAASTISGSTSMMKASWDNLVVGIADDNADFDTLISNFVESASTAMGNLIPRIEIALNGIAQLIQELVPILMELIPPLITSVLPKILQAAVQIVQALIEGIVIAFPTLIQTISTLLPQIITLITDLIPQITEALLGALPLLISTILEAAAQILVAIGKVLPQILKQIVAILPQIISAITENIPVLLEASVTMLMSIVEAIPVIIPALIKALPQIIKSIIRVLLNAIPQILSTALKLFMTLITAVGNIIPKLASKLGEIISTIKTKLVDKAKNILKFDWSLPKLKMPHLNISGEFSLSPPKVPKFSIDWYAQGGVFDTPTLFPYGNGQIGGLGEAGAEAIVPLENNTKWLDKIAERLQGGRTPIYLQVDGKTFAEISVDTINQLTRQRGSLPLVIA